MAKKASGPRFFKAKKRSFIKEKQNLLITALASDGRGIAKNNGKTIFVNNALPGEQVVAQICNSRKDYDEAELKQILQASDHRVMPACPYFNRCGGCSLQHLAYEQQVLAKQQQLQKLFSGHQQRQSTEIEWCTPLTAEPQFYRHRIRLAVYAKGKDFKLGFKRLNSHDIINIDSCVIADKSINELLPLLHSLLSQLNKRSLLLECAVSVDIYKQLSLVFMVKANLPDSDYELIRIFANANNVDVTVIHADSPYAKPLLVIGTQFHSYPLADQLHINYQATDFTQVNVAINSQMIQQLLAWLNLSNKDCVADFFCGVGNLTLPMAKHCHHVVGYELVESMVEKGRLNAQLNNITQCDFIHQNLYATDFVYDALVNKAVLDPPRAGAKELCSSLAETITSLLYISCNPATLARDAEILQAAGYRITKLCLIDMFPQTKHMESMMLLER